MIKKISVLGDGGWGTTLAILLFNKGFYVSLWGPFDDYIKVITEKRENVKFLPGVSIPRDMVITSNLGKSLEGSELTVIAIPSQYVRDVCKKIVQTEQFKKMCSAWNKDSKPVFVSVAKGIEVKALKRMSEVIKEELKDVHVVVLSGPSHAEEVARGIPTTVAVSSPDIKLTRFVQQIFFTDRFRVYTNADTIGVELSGALKNIIAIAAGICDGLGFGDNSKAALFTRGLAEMKRLGVALGAQPETFSGLAGMGDLFTTCVSKYGRNRWLGEEIGKGKSLASILASTEMVVEGVKTTESVYNLAEKLKVDMPITIEVYNVLYKNKKPSSAVEDLMKRDAKAEEENYEQYQNRSS